MMGAGKVGGGLEKWPGFASIKRSGDAALGEFGRLGGGDVDRGRGRLGLAYRPPGLGLGFGPLLGGWQWDGFEGGGERARVDRALVRLLGQALHEQRRELWG